MLKELREKKGITQQKLGEITGLAQTTISGYETNFREPSFYNFNLLCDALKLTNNERFALMKSFQKRRK